MNIKVAYTSHYFMRDLILLEIDGKFTKVYKGSGLNGGKVGAILPYTTLMTRQPRFGELREGKVPGYIFKEFYYGGYVTHNKNMSQFPKEINEFIDHLEDTLKDVTTEPIEQDFDNVLEIANKIENDMFDIVGDSDIFDWKTLDSELVEK